MLFAWEYKLRDCVRVPNWQTISTDVSWDSFDFTLRAGPSALPLSKNHFILRCAPLRASLRRKEGAFFLRLPSTYEPSWAQQARPRWLDVLGYSLSPLAGLAPC
jgi:hypothetical protein